MIKEQNIKLNWQKGKIKNRKYNKLFVQLPLTKIKPNGENLVTIIKYVEINILQLGPTWSLIYI